MCIKNKTALFLLLFLFLLLNMEYLQPTILSSSKRPELVPNESLLIQQGKIGLYEG